MPNRGWRLGFAAGDRAMRENPLDRRSFLGVTATAAIGLAFSPARVFAQGSATSPEMNALSGYMSAAGTRALPADVVEHAKHHLIDTLASITSRSPSRIERAREVSRIRLIRLKTINTIDDENVNRSPIRNQLDSKLFLKRGKDRRSSGSQVGSSPGR